MYREFESLSWRMLITIPKGCKMTYGAYSKDDKYELKLIGHDDCLKDLIKKYPDHIYGIAIVKK